MLAWYKASVARSGRSRELETEAGHVEVDVAELPGRVVTRIPIRALGTML